MLRSRRPSPEPRLDQGQHGLHQLAPVRTDPPTQLGVPEVLALPGTLNARVKAAGDRSAGNVERQLGVVARRGPQRPVRQGAMRSRRSRYFSRLMTAVTSRERKCLSMVVSRKSDFAEQESNASG